MTINKILWTIFFVCLLLVATSIYVSKLGWGETMEEKKLAMLKPEIKVKIETLLDTARKKWPAHKTTLAETYRTQKRQDKLFTKGPNTTMVRVSKHTLGLAADIFFVNNKRILKYEEAPYLELGKMAEGLGLTWGGRWKVPFDPNHFELREK